MFRAFTIPFYLYFPHLSYVRHIINLGTDVLGDPRVSLKKLSSVEYVTVHSQVILISVHETIQIFTFHIYQ